MKFFTDVIHRNGNNWCKRSDSGILTCSECTQCIFESRKTEVVPYSKQGIGLQHTTAGKGRVGLINHPTGILAY